MNKLRIEVETSKVVRVCRGSVLVTRVPVDRFGILWTVGLAGCGFTDEEIAWLKGESARVMRDHEARRPGPVKRALVRARNWLLGRHLERDRGEP